MGAAEDMQPSETASNGRIKIPQWMLYVALVIIGWIVSGLVGYSSASSAQNARISVLEEQSRRLHDDVSEIKADIKTLLARRP